MHAWRLAVAGVAAAFSAAPRGSCGSRCHCAHGRGARTNSGLRLPRVALATLLLVLPGLGGGCGANSAAPAADTPLADAVGPSDGPGADRAVGDSQATDPADFGPDTARDGAPGDSSRADAAADVAAGDLADALAFDVRDGAGPRDGATGDTPGPEDTEAGSTDATAADTATDPRFGPLVAAFEAEWERFGRPGAALAVLEDGVVTFARGYGYKDATETEPVAPTTLFRIGSVTKMLTAVAVLQPSAAGAFELPAAYQALVPEFDLAGDPAAASAITVEQLLTHTHGIVDYLEVAAPADEQSDAALEAFVTGRLGETLYFLVPPGTFYNYSNPGYFLLGLLVERQAGLPYAQAMHERVFAPLDMSRTFFAAADVLADGDFAWGRTVADPEAGIPAVVGPADYDNPWGRPAGYAWSGVHDLARFLAFLMAGDARVLADAARLALQAPQVTTLEAGELVAYGYGMGVMGGVMLGDGFHALRWLDHTGGIPGFAAEVAAVPEQGIGLVLLAAADGAYFAGTVAAWFESLVALPPASPPPDIAPDPSRYPAYAGRYVDPYDIGEILITHDNGDLRFDAPLLTLAGVAYDPLLVPTARDNFLLLVDGEPLGITFLQDETDAFRYLRSRPVVALRDDAKLGLPAPAQGLDADAFCRRVHAAARMERFWLARPAPPAARDAAVGHRVASPQ